MPSNLKVNIGSSSSLSCVSSCLVDKGSLETSLELCNDATNLCEMWASTNWGTKVRYIYTVARVEILYHDPAIYLDVNATQHETSR